jgi:hypothetical protein
VNLHALSLENGEHLTPGITRRPKRLLLMTSGVSAVGCMPLLDCGAANNPPLNSTSIPFLTSRSLAYTNESMDELKHSLKILSHLQEAEDSQLP